MWNIYPHFTVTCNLPVIYMTFINRHSSVVPNPVLSLSASVRVRSPVACSHDHLWLQNRMLEKIWLFYQLHWLTFVLLPQHHRTRIAKSMYNTIYLWRGKGYFACTCLICFITRAQNGTVMLTLHNKYRPWIKKITFSNQNEAESCGSMHEICLITLAHLLDAADLTVECILGPRRRAAPRRHYYYLGWAAHAGRPGGHKSRTRDSRARCNTPSLHT